MASVVAEWLKASKGSNSPKVKEIWIVAILRLPLPQVRILPTLAL